MTDHVTGGTVDIVERLRKPRGGPLTGEWPGPTALELEAATEIERLRARLKDAETVYGVTAQRQPDPEHPDCFTDRECELYFALMLLASHATAWHSDYRRWTQGGVTVEPIVSKALRLGSPALPSTPSGTESSAPASESSHG